MHLSKITRKKRTWNVVFREKVKTKGRLLEENFDEQKGISINTLMKSFVLS